jgi:RNA polymerase sigma-70 factor, ECF subfamily
MIFPTVDKHASARFDELVDSYERRIFNLIYRLVGDYDEAADLTQDAFVAAYKAFDSFREDASPYTWLYRIAVNVCKNWFREKDRRRNTEGLSLDDGGIFPMNCVVVNGITDSLPTPEVVLEQGEMSRLVEEAILSLPEDYRIIAVLRDIQGLSYREIAEASNLSVDVVKTRLARARGMLRRKLEPYL